jgi:hypothetical protein
MMTSQGPLKELTADLLSRSLSQKGRTRQPSCGRSRVDPIDQRLVERDIDPHRSAGVGKQGNGEQHCAALDGRVDILVEQNLVYGARRRHVSARALNGFHVLAKRYRGIRNSPFHRIPSREASLNVRKPCAESAARLLFDDSHIVHWQTIQRALRGVPPPPCGEGSGVGVIPKGNVRDGKHRALKRRVRNERSLQRLHPTPNPSPSRGGESRRRLWSRRP